jgi:hypothetical protein
METNNDCEIFEYHGKFYHIPRDKYEVREKYIERVEYIIKLIIEGFDIVDAIKESRKWSNMKNLKCSY